MSKKPEEPKIDLDDEKKGEIQTDTGNEQTAQESASNDALLARIKELEDENKVLQADSPNSAKGEKKTPRKVTAVSEPDPDDELVTVELFYDGEKYKDDLDICINGKRILIKRGVPVQIKRSYALVLEQSIKQDKNTKSMMMTYANTYEKAAAAEVLT